MPKRFTDTQIWEKEWFMALAPKHKCLWRYLTERCDQSGVWEPNWQLASIYIGEPLTKNDLTVFGNQIEQLPNGKIFIPDFINFQYGRLSEQSPAHKPVFKAIEKNSLGHKVFNRVSNTLQEEEKEKELVKEKEEEKLYDDSQIEEKIIDAFDEIYLGKIRGSWTHINFEFELKSFCEKVRGSPKTYSKHTTEGLRLALQSQLRSAKSKPKQSTKLVQ